MEANEILAAVRRAFARETWRKIDQKRFIDQNWGPGRNWPDAPPCDLGMTRGQSQFFDLGYVHYRPADRAAFRSA